MLKWVVTRKIPAKDAVLKTAFLVNELFPGEEDLSKFIEEASSEEEWNIRANEISLLLWRKTRNNLAHDPRILALDEEIGSVGKYAEV